MTTLPPYLVGDLVTGDSLNDQMGVDPDAMSVFSGTTIAGLATATNVEGVVLTLSNFPFRAGYAYEIEYFFRSAVSGGTSPYGVFSKLRRASISGTTFFDPGGYANIGSGQIYSHYGRCIVKCTTADTTQTIVLNAAMNTAGSPTNLNISSGSNSAKMRLSCRKIGLADDYTDAIEMPTA